MYLAFTYVAVHSDVLGLVIKEQFVYKQANYKFCVHMMYKL